MGEAMKEPNMEAINVDELMEKIKTEVRQRRGENRKGDHSFGDPCHVGDFTSDAGCDLGAMEYKEDGYHIDDFLKYHDEDFVANAYQAVLSRSPDPSAFEHFVSNLRSGKMTKAEILGRLRYSAEGRVRHVRIEGLFWKFLIQSSFGIPILGYFMRLMISTLNLPKTMRNFQAMEVSAFSQLKDQGNRLRQLSDTFQPKMDNLESRLNSFESKMNKTVSLHAKALGRKADMAEVSELLKQKADANELIEQLKHKADLWLLDELKNRKADHEALEEVAAQKADREELAELKEKKVGHEEFVEINRSTQEEIRDILRQIRDHKLSLVDQERRLRLLLNEARKRLPETISTEQIEKMVAEEAHLFDAMYVGFEDKFRGTRQDIKKRQGIYLPFLQAAGVGTVESPLIDVGCGRGEWLELLGENGFVAKGVDVNRAMKDICTDLGIDVETGDAVEFLTGQKEKTFGAITGFQIVEHLSTKKLIALFDEAIRVLKPGGIVIFETPNPENILVGSFSFYTDPSHKNPIPPDTLIYLIENRGFVEPEIFRSAPLNCVSYSGGDDALKAIVHRFNMEQDYAVIARKPS